VQSTDAPALVARLQARGVIASCRGSGLRVSFHGDNTEQDVDAVLDALRAESALLVEARAPSTQA
jgi:selenocysteine lyase/cysteine desulfurase